jgi:hypothetical protein
MTIRGARQAGSIEIAVIAAIKLGTFLEKLARLEASGRKRKANGAAVDIEILKLDSLLRSQHPDWSQSKLDAAIGERLSDHGGANIGPSRVSQRRRRAKRNAN